MKWYYESNGQPQGPIQETELRQLRDEGKLVGETLIWRRGMSDWAPLHSISEFSPRPEIHPVAPSSLPRLDPTPGSPRQTPFHKPLPELTPHSRGSTPSTDADKNQRMDSAEPSSSEGAQRTPPLEQSLPEWEQVRSILPIREFFVSLKEILFEPKRTFSQFNAHGGWALPILFLLAAQIVGNFLMIATLRQIPSILEQLLPMVKQVFKMEDVERALSYLLTATLFLLPLGVVLVASILHLALTLVGQSRQPFSTTFRTLCYTFGAGSMLWTIPYTAVTIASSFKEPSAALFALFIATNSMRLWSFYVSLRALSTTHGVSLLRTAISVLATLFCAGVLVPVFFAFLIAAFKG
jgi:hypothetical protein